jgi:hypothetical protein
VLCCVVAPAQKAQSRATLVSCATPAHRSDSICSCGNAPRRHVVHLPLPTFAVARIVRCDAAASIWRDLTRMLPFYFLSLVFFWS